MSAAQRARLTWALPIAAGLVAAALLLVWRSAAAPPEGCGRLGQVGELIGTIDASTDPDQVREELASLLERVEPADLAESLPVDKAERVEELGVRWEALVFDLRSAPPGTPLQDLATPEAIEVAQLLSEAYLSACA